jgi:hypothetical protein
MRVKRKVKKWLRRPFRQSPTVKPRFHIEYSMQRRWVVDSLLKTEYRPMMKEPEDIPTIYSGEVDEGMRIYKSIDIAATPEKVWPFLTEAAHLIKWVPVERIEQTCPGKLCLNTTFSFEEKAAGFLLKLNLKVTECLENQKLAFRMISGNTVKGYSQWYTLEPIDTGCRFKVIEDVTMPLGIIGGVFGLFRTPMSNGRLVNMLKKLKILAEA